MFSVNVSIWSLSTSSGLSNHRASSSEKSPTWNFTNHFWHVQSVRATSPYIVQKLSLLFSFVLTFSEIIKPSMPKMLLRPPIFNIKTTKQTTALCIIKSWIIYLFSLFFWRGGEWDLFPNQGWNSGPWQGQHRTLTTGLPGDSLFIFSHYLVFSNLYLSLLCDL